MSKCNQCRKQPVKDSLWDKFRLYLFHFFHNDIVDLSQDKFTQGFSDGYVVGRKHQKDESQELIELLSEPQPKEKLFLLADMEKVLTSNKSGQLFLNGVLIEAKKLQDLKQEAILFKNTAIWDIISNTLKHQAQEIMYKESMNTQDFLNGKTFIRVLDIQQNIIKKIESIK